MSTFISSITEQDVRSVGSASPGDSLGIYGGTPDGRIYRLGRAGAVALAPGKIVTPPAVVANHQNRVATAAQPVGSFEVQVTLGATAATFNQYMDGFLTVNDAAGEGITYAVEGNDAAASAGTLAVRLKEAVQVPLTTSSEVTLHTSPLDALVVSPAASGVAQQTVGVPNITVPISNYAWFQVGGYASVLSDGAITKGLGCIISDAVDGAVEVEAAATVAQRVGRTIEATADTEYRTIDLTIW